jgi:hypothetical protein
MNLNLLTRLKFAFDLFSMLKLLFIYSHKVFYSSLRYILCWLELVRRRLSHNLASPIGGNGQLSFVKVKSWSVKVVDGYILNDQVRSAQCKGCDSAAKLVVGNNDDPNLILYGCGGHKCKHTLIRMDFGSENS